MNDGANQLACASAGPPGRLMVKPRSALVSPLRFAVSCNWNGRRRFGHQVSRLMMPLFGSLCGSGAQLSGCSRRELRLAATSFGRNYGRADNEDNLSQAERTGDTKTPSHKAAKPTLSSWPGATSARARARIQALPAAASAAPSWRRHLLGWKQLRLLTSLRARLLV